MKLTPSSTASHTSRAASSSVLPDLSPIREKPPVPSPATLTRSPVRPRVVYSMRCFLWDRPEGKIGSAPTPCILLPAPQPVDPPRAFVSRRAALDNRRKRLRINAHRPLQRRRGRGQVAESLGRARHLRHEERGRSQQVLRAGDVPLP